MLNFHHIRAVEKYFSKKCYFDNFSRLDKKKTNKNFEKHIFAAKSYLLTSAKFEIGNIYDNVAYALEDSCAKVAMIWTCRC